MLCGCVGGGEVHLHAPETRYRVNGLRILREMEEKYKTLEQQVISQMQYKFLHTAQQYL